MKMFRRATSPCAGVVVAASFLICIPAFAQSAASAEPEAAAAEAAPAPDWTFTSNVAIASQYISRGFRQTWGKPALQGGMDVAHSSGFFAGTWASTVSDRFVEDAAIEWDLYAGYAGTVGDFGYGATLYYYVYPGARLAYADASYNYAELVPTVSWKFLSVKYWYTISRDYFGYNDRSLLTTAETGDRHSRGSGYLDVNANVDLGAGFTLQLHYGAQRVKNFGFANWQDGKIGVAKSFEGGWSASAAYTRAWDKDNYYKNYTTGATDSNGHVAVSDPTKGTFIFTVARTF